MLNRIASENTIISHTFYSWQLSDCVENYVYVLNC